MSQEATVRAICGTTNWFKIGKGVYQVEVFIFYAEYIMQNVWLDELQVGIKISSRSINSLRYVDDTTAMAESEEKIKNLLMRVKEESEKAGLQRNMKEN